MPNAFSTINTELYGNLILQGYLKYMLPIQSFTVDASPAPSYRGANVKVLSVPNNQLAAQDYTSTYSIQASSGSGVDVNLNRHKFVSWQLLDSEYRDSSILSMESFLVQKGAQLAEAVLGDVLNSFTSSAFTPVSSSVALADFSASKVSSVSLTCDNLAMPQFGRSLILNPSYHQKLRTDSALQNAAAFGGSSVIQSGVIPSCDSFEAIYKTHLLPSGSNGLAVHPSCRVFVSRTVAPQEPNTYNFVKTFSDPETGLSLTLLGFHNSLEGSQNWIVTCEYGFANGNVSGSVKLY